MATYNELRSLFGEGTLQNKIEVAVCVKAQAVFAEATPSATRLAWADSALGATAEEAKRLTKYVLAANKGLTLSQIMGATDAAIQAQVDTAIDKLHP